MTYDLQLGSIFNIYCHSGATVSHTFFSLSQGMHRAGLGTQMFVPNCDDKLRCSNMTEAVPRLLKPVIYRFSNGPRFFTETLFLRKAGGFDGAYFFPDASLSFLRKIKERKIPLLSERINCHTRFARDILTQAYDDLKLPAGHGISDEMIAEEDEQLTLSDFIFCPSPEVLRSLIASGVPKSKLIPTSYGWGLDRFSGTALRKRENSKQDALKILFVGTVSVRKGAHILLRAWEKAKINGKLLLCGKLDPAIQITCGHILDRHDVIWTDFQADIGSFYAEADIFAFPSLEEGGPLVTYEAMAHCLPVVVSPMAAGAIVRDKVDGVIVPGTNAEHWAEELRRLAADEDLRNSLGEAAAHRARSFTWDLVGASRARLFLDRLSPRA